MNPTFSEAAEAIESIEAAEATDVAMALAGVPQATRELSAFLAELRCDDIPADVMQAARALLLDWFGSVLAGRNARPVRVLETFARDQGPAHGLAECFTHRQSTSPYFAALINGASSHVVEQDDLHNASVLHPATVVFPALLAAAAEGRHTGHDLLVAAIAGYEAGIRIGEFLGRSHYRVFHTTATVGTLAAAVAVAKLRGYDQERILQTLGSAGTQAAGLWEFLREAADSKQLHTAKAAANGYLAAWLAGAGLTGARNILEGRQGLAAGMSSDADAAALRDGLGRRWATAETSFKYFASCRHTHPAADALLKLLRDEALDPADLESVTTHVHQGAIDVLGAVDVPSSVHQAKFSMGTVLGLVAWHGHAGLLEFDRHALSDPRVAALREKVEMVLDPEVDTAYPRRWIGRVTARDRRGVLYEARVDVPKGDPGNALTREELEAKVLHLAAYADGASPAEVRGLIDTVWSLGAEPLPARWLPTP